MTTEYPAFREDTGDEYALGCELQALFCMAYACRRLAPPGTPVTVLGDDGACAGIIAGGTTMSSVKNCRAVNGSITAEGNATWGFGAVCGAPWGTPEIKDCEAVGTKITVSGEGNRLVGGLVGFGGSYDETAPAQITGCKVEDVVIVVSDSTDCVGDLIYGLFPAEHREPSLRTVRKFCFQCAI